MSKFEKRELEITSLNDQRLMIIDPTKKGFFDEVLNYPYKRNERILYKSQYQNYQKREYNFYQFRE